MARIEVYIVAGLFAVVLVGGGIAYVYNKGETAGTSAVKTEVQSKTIETITKAQEAKEKADAEVRSTPYGERVDVLK